MAWSTRKTSVAVGAMALLAEAGLNNTVVMGVVYAAASGVAGPVIVHGVVVAHDAEEARLAADRRAFAANGGRHRSSTAQEPGDADQEARQSDENADDSPDMPRRLGPMLVARRSFLEDYEGDLARVRPILAAVDSFLRDDQRAFASFARRADRDPSWATVHGADLADLRDMDTRLDALRTRAAGE